MNPEENGKCKQDYLNKPSNREISNMEIPIRVLMPLYHLKMFRRQPLIISDQIVIKRIDKDDLKLVEKEYGTPSFATTFEEYPKYCVDMRISLKEQDWVHENEEAFEISEFIEDMSYQLQRILTTFRILKEGEIHSNRILFLSDPPEHLFEFVEKPIYFLGEYVVYAREIDNFLKIYNKIMTEEKDSIILSLRWFDKAHIETYAEDALIDLMIAFEALVFEGETSAIRGRTIAIAVAMLIGENEKERTHIKNQLSDCYRVRNLIIHSSKKEIDVKDDQLSDLKQYFRRALKKILLDLK